VGDVTREHIYERLTEAISATEFNSDALPGR
jgi:hypothetical protein